jgi:hypothetical protein
LEQCERLHGWEAQVTERGWVLSVLIAAGVICSPVPVVGGSPLAAAGQTWLRSCNIGLHNKTQVVFGVAFARRAP